jgi:hypothetical protein
MTQKPKQTNSEQSKRFIKMARELGEDETGKAFERAVKRVSRQKSAKEPKRPSDSEIR